MQNARTLMPLCMLLAACTSSYRADSVVEPQCTPRPVVTPCSQQAAPTHCVTHVAPAHTQSTTPSCKARLGSALLGPVVAAGVFAYGFAVWDYGSGSFHVADEAWFGRDSDYGGADKIGHAVAGHFFTTGISRVHRWWGFDRMESARRGALTAFGVLTAMEVGDGLSEEHGFSWRDLAFDAMGCAFGYFHESSPSFADTLDLRWEYWPSAGWSNEDNTDPITAYDDSAFLLAVNVGAVVKRHRPVLDLVDLQVGYQVRDLDLGPDERRQEVFVGAGLNLANFLRGISGGRVGGIFDYYQVPSISLRMYVDLND